MGKDKPTLGKGGNATNVGFSKRSPLRMEVDPQEVAAMQRGYEARIARQRDALDRMTALLEQRTQELKDLMDKQAVQAAYIDETDVAPRFTGEQLSDEDLDDLLRLVPENWDSYSVDDKPRTAVEKYIKYCVREAEEQRKKQEYLVKNYQTPMDELLLWLGPRVRKMDIAGDGPFQWTMNIVQRLERELSTARDDAANNAMTANQAHAKLAVVAGDDTPPWDDPDVTGPAQSFVQPATVGASGVWSNEPPESESESIGWSGAGDLMKGEQRPGSF